MNKRAMNQRAILAIMRKDLKVAAQNRGVVLPVIILPVILFVILPWFAMLGPTWTGGNMGNTQSLETQINQLMASMPSGMVAELAGHSPAQQMSIFMLVYGLAPMFLIMPLMVSSVLAADSFAGEKERKTLEALLYSPTTDRELFTAKILGPWAAAMVIALASFVLYAAMVDLSGWIVMKELLLPNPMWIALVLWVCPAVAGIGLVVMVFVSARAQGFQDAYQTGGMVVLPILALMAGQITGVMYFTLGVVLLLGLVFWLIVIALLWQANQRFQREQLMPKG
jgi:ABC-2 type transport system permease protein